MRPLFAASWISGLMLLAPGVTAAQAVYTVDLRTTKQAGTSKDTIGLQPCADSVRPSVGNGQAGKKDTLIVRVYDSTAKLTGTPVLLALYIGDLQVETPSFASRMEVVFRARY
jgi:hypothetical protein